ncbi:hypothetical protein GIB67_016501 [Kingdonia uniflora]|uniref:Retrotransposon Copia-like N-terminal domain-containing protein n=1 Tax=Kingdonia uniflora TaxID=39325 RepID=A0A7J7M826_9MAGN|nr:hypothetical protein GIB67_016501 [Kingdonia uniflora]
MPIGDELSSSSTVSSIGMGKDVQSFNSVHDNLNLKITSQLLDGLNYVRWAQSAKLLVGGRYSRSSWEELSHYDSFIKWPANAPSEKIPPPPTEIEIYVKIMEKTRLFQFLPGLNPDFEYARVHLLDMTPFLTLEEAHTYYLSNQSHRSPMPPISRIPSETSAMAARYAYLIPLSVPSQTSQTSSPSLSPLPFHRVFRAGLALGFGAAARMSGIVFICVSLEDGETSILPGILMGGESGTLVFIFASFGNEEASTMSGMLMGGESGSGVLIFL